MRRRLARTTLTAVHNRAVGEGGLARTILFGFPLSIRFAAGLYVENRFNNVISAAQSYHRLRFSHEIRPKQEFKRFAANSSRQFLKRIDALEN